MFYLRKRCQLWFAIKALAQVAINDMTHARPDENKKYNVSFKYGLKLVYNGTNYKTQPSQLEQD